MNVLITGGTGYFGQAFAKRLLSIGAERVCIFSRSESKQAEMQSEINDDRMRYFIGDVRDRDRLRRAMEDVDLVVHAAALKRIEVGKYNPSEMVKTNVIGSMNVIEAATDAGVKKVIALSTDKAYQPLSAYGQSKALSESLFIAADYTRGRRGPIFSAVRYGNVSGSTGSVIPIWRKILEKTDTVPVTDPECTRFWMHIDEAVDLVLSTYSTMKGGEIVIPSLPAYRLGDLAEAMGAKMDVSELNSFEKRHESMEAGKSSETARRMSVEELREALKLV